MTRRSPDCLSDLRIDRMLAGDLDGGDRARARDHVAGCTACAARVAAFEAARAAIPPGSELEAIRRIAAAAPVPPARRAWRGLWPPLALAAGLAGLVVVVRPPAPRPRGAGEERIEGATRTKGAARLGFFVKHGGSVRRGGAGEPVNPGDLVRFVVSTPRPAHLAIIGMAVGVDGGAAASVYFPVAGVADTVAAGTDIELPRATLLDDTLGPEIVAAFFCERPVDLDALRARPPSPPPGCTVDRLDWVKVAAR